jgi:hypothetical protein
MSAATISALDYLTNLASQNFWGTVTLKFENGEIVHVRQEENLKPSELSGKPRRTYGSAS